MGDRGRTLSPNYHLPIPKNTAATDRRREDEMLTAYATKLIWWALPKIMGSVIDKIGDGLALVESAEQKSNDFERRAIMISNLQTLLPPAPEFIIRGYLEFLVILYSIGVTSDALNTMEEIVSQLDADSLASDDKRQAALSSFAALFPGVPERVVRLLVELSVARLRSRGIEV